MSSTRPAPRRAPRPAPRPLRDHEWPIALVVSIALAGALAIGVCVGGLVIQNHQKGASVPGAIFLTVFLLVLAGAMFRRRYWAVLAFWALVGFQVLAAAIALMLASTLRAAGVCVLAIGLGSWLFWHLMKLLARMRAAMEEDLPAGERQP